MALLYEIAPTCMELPDATKSKLDELIQQRRTAIDLGQYVEASALTARIRMNLYLSLSDSDIVSLKACGVI